MFLSLLLLLAAQAQGAMIITPSTPGIILGSSLTPPTTSTNCEVACVNTAFGLTGASALTAADLLYKSDVFGTSGIGSDSGAFAGSYTTTFSNSATDPEDALIQYVLSQPALSCPACYLAIKDGNQSPSYYFYNLASWNGTENLSLQDFWPRQGAISHVSIWGRRDGGTPPAGVPAPGAVVLMAIGLMAIGVSKIRRKSRAGQA